MKNRIDIMTPNELLDELRSLVAEAEKLMSDQVATPTVEAVSALRDRFKVTQARLAELYADTKDRVIAGARYTDESIRAHPYPSLAIALGVGALAGVLIGRRCGR